MSQRLLAAAVLIACLLVPASSAMASGADVLKDCNTNGRLTKTYTQKELRQALAQMPSDVREYSDCANIIRKAELGLNGAGGPGGPGSQATAQNPFAGASPAEAAQLTKEIEKARRSGGRPQRVGTAAVTPGSLAYHQIKSVSKLPLPLMILVVLMGVGASALAGYLVYRRRGHPADPGA
jgi:hypothetical protein